MKKHKKVMIVAVVLLVIIGLFKCGSSGSGSVSDYDDNSYEQEEYTADTETEDMIAEYEEESEESEEMTEEYEDAFIPYGFTVQDGEIGHSKDGYFIIRKESTGLCSLVNANGEEVLPAEYDSMIFPKPKTAEAVYVKAENKWGIFDYNGTEILPIEYDAIDAYGNESEHYLAEKDGKQYIIGLDGTLERELQGVYSQIFGNSFLCTNRENEGLDSFWMENPSFLSHYTIDAVYNLNEEKIYEQNVQENYNDISYHVCNGKDRILIYDENSSSWDDFGVSRNKLIDENGNTLCPISDSLMSGSDNVRGYGFDFTENDSLLILRSYNKNYEGRQEGYLYNINTNEISDAYYTTITCSDEDEIYAVTHEKTIDIYGNDGILDRSISFEDSDKIAIEDGSSLILAKYGNTFRIYDKDGMEISDERYLGGTWIEDYALLENMNGQYGLMDPKGKMVVPFGALDFEENDSSLYYIGRKYSWESYIKDGYWYITTYGSDELSTKNVDVLDVRGEN